MGFATATVLANAHAIACATATTDDRLTVVGGK